MIRRKFWQRAIHWIFGYDLFISYSRIDWNEQYAINLAEKLSQAPFDFKCFLDAKGMESGASWKVQGRWALQRSSKIILLLTPGILHSKGVRDELEFNCSLRERRKPVAIVNVANAWDQVSQNPELMQLLSTAEGSATDSLRIDEENAAVPSRTVIEKINSDFKLRRENTKRSYILGIASIVLFILASAAGVFGGFAQQQSKEAKKQRDAALLTQSKFLSDAAERHTSDTKDPITGALLALEALTDNQATNIVQRERPYWSTAEVALGDAVRERHELASLHGHIYAIRTLVLSADGSIAVSGALDGTARIWDIKSRQPKLILDGQHCTGNRPHRVGFGCQIYAVAISNDGSYVITGGNDHTARVWDAKTGQQRLIFDEHTDSVGSIAISPDGSFVVTAGDTSNVPQAWDTTARIWDPTTGVVMAKLEGHMRPISDIAIGPAGDFIATVSFDGTARLWEAPSGKLRATLEGHTGPLHEVAVSHDGTFLVTSSSDTTARIWNAKTGNLRTTLEDHSGEVYSLAISRDDAFIVTGSLDGTARIWNATTGAPGPILKNYQSYGSTIAISHDNTIVYTARKDKSVAVWDAHSGKLQKVLNGHARAITNVLASPDGKFVVTSGDDHTVRIWQIGNQAEAGLFSEHSQAVAKVVLSKDNTFFVTRSWDDTALIRYIGSKTAPIQLTAHGSFIGGLAIGNNGRFVVTAGGRREISTIDGVLMIPRDEYRPGTISLPVRGISAFVWDARSGKRTEVLKGHTWPINQIAVSADGRFIVTASDDSTARIWNTSDWTERAVLKGHSAEVERVAISSDSRFVVTGSKDKTARIWDANTGKLQWELRGHEHFVPLVAISPNGKWVFTGSLDKTARIWNAKTGKLKRELTGHTHYLKGLAVSPDGTILVTGSEDKTLRIWDVETGELQRRLVAHTDGVTGVAITSDSRFIISISGRQNIIDNTVRVWNVETGEQRAILRGHTKSITSLALASDDSFVVTTSSDKTARMWKLFRTAQDLVDLAKDEVPRCLTTDERERYFLRPEPPRWCITGPRRTHIRSPSKWLPKWPYHTPEWRQWLVARDRGEDLALPEGIGVK